MFLFELKKIFIQELIYININYINNIDNVL